MDTDFEIKKLQNFKQIQEKVKEFVEKKKEEYITSKRVALENVFPGLSTIEYDCLLNRYVKLNRLIDYNRCKETDVEMPERYNELLQIQKEPKRNKSEMVEFQHYQNALVIPNEYHLPDFYNSLFPVKNTLLTLQVVNRLARQYEIRVEDVETVIHEAIYK